MFRWKEIAQAILLQQEKEIPDSLSWEDHCNIISSNPVTACRMFERRVNLFINDVILSAANPIGKVVDYFYRYSSIYINTKYSKL